MKNENETITVKIFRDDYRNLVDKKFETKLSYSWLLKAAINVAANNPELWDEEIEKIKDIVS